MEKMSKEAKKTCINFQNKLLILSLLIICLLFPTSVNAIISVDIFDPIPIINNTLVTYYVPYNNATNNTNLNIFNLSAATIFYNNYDINASGFIGLECFEGQVIKYSMVFDLWYCANDNDNQNLQEVTDEGSSTTNPITMNGGNLNVNEGNILISNSGAGIQRAINYTNSNPFGIGSFGINNDVGAFITMAIVGSEINIPNQSLKNDSGVVFNGGQGFALVNANESFLIGHVVEGDGNFSNIRFTTQFKPNGDVIMSGDLILNLSSLSLDGDDDHFIRVNEGDVFDGIALNATHFGHNAMRDDGEVTYLFTWEEFINLFLQAGRNNSVSGLGNSFFVMPNYWGSENFTDVNGTINMTSLTDYPFLCSFFGDEFNVDCEFFADTRGRGLPLLATGDLEVWLSAVIHNGLLVKEDFEYIGNLGEDADFLFNGGLENGKVHIRDKRQILANITFFDIIVTNFDDGTINPFVSESIAPEVGRDWDSVSETECHEDRCANAKGGNEKVMSFSASTTFEDGTVASNNTHLLFYITSVLSGLDTFEVELDDNEGNVSIIYNTSVVLLDQLINVSFPSEFENKSNVTTSFILNGQNVNREVWIDIIRVTSEPAEAIEINESYDGGRIVLGQDRGNLSCGIYVDKYIPNGTTETQWRTNLGSSDCVTNIVGAVTFTDSTVVNQTVLGDLTVTGTITQNGSTLDDTYVNVDGDNMSGNLNMDGNQVNNVSVLDNGGSEITVNDDVNVKDNGLKFENNSVVYSLRQRTNPTFGIEELSFEDVGQGEVVLNTNKGFMLNTEGVWLIDETETFENRINSQGFEIFDTGSLVANLQYSSTNSLFSWNLLDIDLKVDINNNRNFSVRNKNTLEDVFIVNADGNSVFDTTLTLSSGSIADSTNLITIPHALTTTGILTGNADGFIGDTLKVNSNGGDDEGLIVNGGDAGPPGNTHPGWISINRGDEQDISGYMWMDGNSQWCLGDNKPTNGNDCGNFGINMATGSFKPNGMHMVDEAVIEFGEPQRELQIWADTSNHAVMDVLNELRIGNEITNYAEFSSTGNLEFYGSANTILAQGNGISFGNESLTSTGNGTFGGLKVQLPDSSIEVNEITVAGGFLKLAEISGTTSQSTSAFALKDFLNVRGATFDPKILFINADGSADSSIEWDRTTDVMKFQGAVEYNFDNDVNITGTITSNSLNGTYTNGEAYLCVYDNGTIFAKDTACN